MMQSEAYTEERSHTFFESSQYQSQSSFDEIHYQRKIGSYTPHFEGLPEDYWPMSKKDIALGIFLLVLLIGFFTGISVGIVQWCIFGSTETFAVVWSILFIIFWIVFALMSFSNSKGRYQNNERNVRLKIRQLKVGYIERFNLASGKARKKSLMMEMKQH